MSKNFKNRNIIIASIIGIILLIVLVLEFTVEYHPTVKLKNCLVEDEPLETNISYYYYVNGWNVRYNSLYVLNNDEFKLTDTEVTTGYGKYTSVSALDNLYKFTNTSNYDELTDKLGTYDYYNKYEDSEIFVFYDDYNEHVDQNVLNVAINKNGKLTILQDNIERGKSYFPEYTYRDDNYYYLLFVEEKDNNPNAKIYKIDIAKMKMDIFDFEFTGRYSDNESTDILVENEKVYLCFDEMSCIGIYDTITQNFSKTKIEDLNSEFFIRDEDNIYCGCFDNNMLNVQKLSFDLEIEDEYKIPIKLDYIDLSHGSPFCKNNKLYLEFIKNDNDIDTFIYYSCIVDLESSKITNLYEYKGICYQDSVRYLKKHNMEYVEEPYQSSK